MKVIAGLSHIAELVCAKPEAWLGAPPYFWGVVFREYLKLTRSCYSCVNLSLTTDSESLMKHTWILDVLMDLKTFAALNDLPTLAAQLDETHRIAAAELEDLTERQPIGSNCEPCGRGPQPGRLGTRFRA